MRKHVLILVIAASFAVNLSGGRSAAPGDAEQVFERRIVPILQSPGSSSCSQCHLGGVDLKNYLLSSAEKTFVSLRDQGLIDVQAPAKSKILSLIKMGAKDKPEAAKAFDKKRQAEYDAMLEWLTAACSEPQLRDAPKLPGSDVAKPPRPVEVIRHERKDRLLASFENNIWAMRFRCMNCHTEGSEENTKFKKEYGERVAWMKAAGPEATMRYLITSKLINVKEPANSLLLLKPLADVEHKGGKKFLPGDLGYKAFRAWLEDYANIARDRYTAAADLPKPNKDGERFGTDIWLKIENTPPAWADKLLQTTIYAWDAKKNQWEDTPIAISDRGVWGKGRLWQHNLTLIARKDSARDKDWKQGQPKLAAGRYLIRVHVDFQNREAADWHATLDKAEWAGQTEVQSSWPEGYGKMTVVDAGRVRK